MRILAAALTAAIALTAAQTTAAQTRVKPVDPTPAPTLQKKAPAPAKPDLVVVSHQKAGPTSVKLRIENKGAGAAAANHVWLRNESNLGANAYPIDAIPAGYGKWIEVEVQPQVNAGDLFNVEIDFYKKVAESNESNNRYRFVW